MEPIKFISPSSLFYWHKCPLKAIFSREYRNQQFLPKHPDADLGDLVHRFFEKKKEWEIFSKDAFEIKWKSEVQIIDQSYFKSKLQKIYFPIKWSAKYFAIKKVLLRNSLLKEAESSPKKQSTNIKYEEWIDDGKDIGGFVDFMIINGKNEVVEIVDFKTGKIFEFVEKRKVIKEAYLQQISLYAYIVKCKQDYYPKCCIKDIKGNKYPIEINEKALKEIYELAIELKSRINKSIEDLNFEMLANPVIENCINCEYRPVCSKYKSALINNFESKRVDIFGVVVDVKGVDKVEMKIKVNNKYLVLRGVTMCDKINIGDRIYVYNLFCPDESSRILFAMKETLIEIDKTN